ncbi:polynucleotide kinase-phosphatase [Planomonospora venezuelensis]|uniref:Polynucleotide kinase-phosphatase n=1 Tax=Planomonospora venezuelensis TaxID=1999 RepID=A0A841D0V2_PLAVE|nr:polynucleotide kinase-phosphatase [Planomonospora venezuelensis]MBB5964292.1 polynucleotide kinase-phosphatase [Planomonospora venezuelensis]GIN02610.1 polynucleotide kinase-phosphatase [Planomonospora venezuelensis]
MTETAVPEDGGDDLARAVPETGDPATGAAAPAATEIAVPAMSLVVLVGVSGSGKSTFARRHFAPTQVISSDFCRGLVADDENDQAATPDAFDVLHYIVRTRLRRGLLTVVDATNVQWEARRQLIDLAKSENVLVDAVVLDVPEEVAIARNEARPDRDFGPQVVRRQRKDLRRSLGKISRDGFRRVHVLRGVEQIEAAAVVTEKAWTDRRELTGPFDIIGDVHGCRAELEALLRKLGWEVTPAGASHPEGRTAVFVGDLVDRGPDTPGVLRLVMGMVAAGTALCVSGNHEQKLARALNGRKVRVAHGLQESLDQLSAEPEEFRTAALAFMDGLISHYQLDGGGLVVAHAGLKEAYHGRASGRVRSFALYGDTTGETDEYGLPVRYPWAREYRGRAMVVYGHTPVPEPEWINNTICLDTGVVFGGRLTALRYPSREIVSVPAEKVWYEPVKPFAAPGHRDPETLSIDDVRGTRHIEVRYGGGRIKVREENSAAALEIMSRFAVDPRWLVYLPPTMAPPETSRLDGHLEHPAEAFAEFAAAGVGRVVCEEKHMGSRAVAVLARTPEAAAARFGVEDGSAGAVYTRTGRPFFDDAAVIGALVDRLRSACAPLMDELGSDWLVLDCELLPWSAKAEGLIRNQYASVGAAARTALPETIAALEAAAGRGLGVGGLLDRTRRRLDNAARFRDAYARYCWPVSGLEGLRVAPFQILACEGRATAATEPHSWHLEALSRLEDPLIAPTRHVYVDLDSEESRQAATVWWEALTAEGGEGMVVKPLTAPAGPAGSTAPPGRTGASGPEGEAEPRPVEVRPGRVQPGIKVRGREYLRIIYGPDYTESLDVLRNRFLGRKRSLALREHALGLEALSRLAEGEPLWRVHEAVFAVLALESEPVDPRL